MGILRKSAKYGFIQSISTLLNLVRGIIVANILGPYLQGIKGYMFYIQNMLAPLAAIVGKYRVDILNKKEDKFSAYFWFSMILGIVGAIMLFAITNIQIQYKIFFFTLVITYLFGLYSIELRGLGKYIMLSVVLLKATVIGSIVIVVLTYLFKLEGFIIGYSVMYVYLVISLKKHSKGRIRRFTIPTELVKESFWYVLMNGVYATYATIPFVVYKLKYDYIAMGLLTVTVFLMNSISMVVFEILQPYTNMYYEDARRYNLDKLEYLGVFALVATAYTYIFGKWIAKFVMPKYVAGFELVKYSFLMIVCLAYIANRMNRWFKGEKEKEFVLGVGGVSAMVMVGVLAYTYFTKITNLMFLILVSTVYLIVHLMMIDKWKHRLFVGGMFVWANVPLFFMNPGTILDAVVAAGLYFVWMLPFLVIEEQKVGVLRRIWRSVMIRYSR